MVGEFIKVRLETSEGIFVRRVSIPKLKGKPQVVVWNDRVFLYDVEDYYRETTFAVAFEEHEKPQPEQPDPFEPSVKISKRKLLDRINDVEGDFKIELLELTEKVEALEKRLDEENTDAAQLGTFVVKHNKKPLDK